MSSRELRSSRRAEEREMRCERFIHSMSDGSQQVKQYGSPCPRQDCHATTRVMIIYNFLDEPATNYVLYCKECSSSERYEDGVRTE